MSRFCPLFSGSSGNSTFVGTSTYGILVDIGCSYKCTCTALLERNISPEDIRAVAVTHTHSDHTSGLKTFLKKHPVPLIASRITIDALIVNGIITEEHPTLCADDDEITVCDIKIKEIPTCHDCEGSAGYIFSLPDERRIAIFTDLGYVSDEILSGIKGSDLVMLESNHDINRLKKGNYPFYLKERILSDCGHLSNAACAAVLPTLVKNGTTRIVLAHLSRENNLPTLALSTAKAALIDAGLKENIDYILYVAPVRDGRMFIL